MSKFRNYDKYEIYEDGRIFSYWTNKFLKQETTKCGYQRVRLVDNEGKQKRYQVHRIVYETFSGSPIPEGMQCNHISEDKSDNRFCNINLLTPKENCNWGSRNSRVAKANTNGKCSKQVGAFKNGKLMFTFPSAKEGGRNGFDQGHISACCRGESKTHKGYEWRYL